jgi:hypothetical protein
MNSKRKLFIGRILTLVSFILCLITLSFSIDDKLSLLLFSTVAFSFLFGFSFGE